MTAAEMTFCRAEGAMLGWDMGGTPGALYNQAVRLSFEQWGYFTRNITTWKIRKTHKSIIMMLRMDMEAIMHLSVQSR